LSIWEGNSLESKLRFYEWISRENQKAGVHDLDKGRNVLSKGRVGSTKRILGKRG